MLLLFVFLCNQGKDCWDGKGDWETADAGAWMCKIKGAATQSWYGEGATNPGNTLLNS